MAAGAGEETTLEREISPFMLAAYSLATMLGAGIYVVIGEIAGEAGYLTPLAFLVAATAAAFSAMSYAELGARFPVSGGSAAYVDRAFHRPWLTLLTGWAVIATGLVSAATIATGFAGYLAVFLPWPREATIVALVAGLTAIAAIGIREAAWFMLVSTLAGIAGLLIVIAAAGPAIGDYPALAAEAMAAPDGWTMGVVAGSFLAFYAFIGFEDLVTLGEEAEQVEKAMPRAILLALGIALLLYLATAIAAVSSVDPAALAASAAPLVAVAEANGSPAMIVAAISLVVIVDGALAQIVMVSRVVHDLGRRRGGAPRWLARVHARTRTPLVATLLAGAIVATLALLYPTASLARATSLIVLSVFVAANAALIAVKIRKLPAPEGVRNYPVVVPVLGILVSLALIVSQLWPR